MDTVQYKTLDEFIVLHKANHINYCEIVVKPNGRVEYAIPSHLSKLEQIWGVPDEELFDNGPIRRSLYNEMPMTVSPIHWLSGDLRCIVCWFNGLIIPLNYTENSLRTVKQLIQHRCISNHCSIEVTIEKERELVCNDRDKMQLLFQKREQVERKVIRFLRGTYYGGR